MKDGGICIREEANLKEWNPIIYESSLECLEMSVLLKLQVQK